MRSIEHVDSILIIVVEWLLVLEFGVRVCLGGLRVVDVMEGDDILRWKWRRFRLVLVIWRGVLSVSVSCLVIGNNGVLIIHRFQMEKRKKGGATATTLDFYIFFFLINVIKHSYLEIVVYIGF